MILNTTKKRHVDFSVAQRLATRGEDVISQRVANIKEFDSVYFKYEEFITQVIIDPRDFILANDICNTVTCKIVTLDTERILGQDDWAFQEYNPEED